MRDKRRVLRQTTDASATPSQLAGPVLPDELVAEAVVTFDAKARRNYAGTSPITKASGTRRVVLARYPRNKRLADALHQQAFAALTASPGARAFYDSHRARGATHNQALRTLSNASSGSSTDACATEPLTAKPPPGHTAPPQPLDDIRPWDI